MEVQPFQVHYVFGWSLSAGDICLSPGDPAWGFYWKRRMALLRRMAKTLQCLRAVSTVSNPQVRGFLKLDQSLGVLGTSTVDIFWQLVICKNLVFHDQPQSEAFKSQSTEICEANGEVGQNMSACWITEDLNLSCISAQRFRKIRSFFSVPKGRSKAFRMSFGCFCGRSFGVFPVDRYHARSSLNSGPRGTLASRPAGPIYLPQSFVEQTTTEKSRTLKVSQKTACWYHTEWSMFSIQNVCWYAEYIRIWMCLYHPLSFWTLQQWVDPQVSILTRAWPDICAKDKSGLVSQKNPIIR